MAAVAVAQESLHCLSALRDRSVVDSVVDSVPPTFETIVRSPWPLKHLNSNSAQAVLHSAQNSRSMTISVNPFRRRTHTACQWLPDSRSALTSNEGMKENHSGQSQNGWKSWAEGALSQVAINVVYRHEARGHLFSSSSTTNSKASCLQSAQKPKILVVHQSFQHGTLNAPKVGVAAGAVPLTASKNFITLTRAWPAPPSKRP